MGSTNGIEPVLPPDTELVRRVRGGDREAFRLLVDRYAPMIFRLTNRFVSDSQDAEDLAQDIFVKAFNGLHRFEDNTNFSVWLYTIGANRCRDYAKNIRRTVQPMSRIEHAQVEPSMRQVETQEAELERKEQAERIRWAIGQLSPDYATPFLMKYEADYTYDDMARMLNLSVGALKVRVHRARRELQDLLRNM